MELSSSISGHRNRIPAGLKKSLSDETKDSTPMDSDNEVMETEQKVEPNEDANLEPFVGMEFDSEDAAREFYLDYARRLGFVVRIMQRRRSGLDGRTLARRLGCNKQGFSPNQRGAKGPEKKPRPSAREGCNATILVKMEKSGKWVVTRFVKEHNHSLSAPTNGFGMMVDKDKRISFLRSEIERQDRLREGYREQLLSFLNNVEQQNEELSLRVRGVVENIRKLESEMSMHSRHSSRCQGCSRKLLKAQKIVCEASIFPVQ